jgi:RNA polymerase sigma factor (sigma-70 family)
MLRLLNEKVLIEECRKQDRSAQKALFETHFKKMMAICLRYLKNEQDALEVINVAFLKVFSKITQYKSECSLEAWIRRIVINSTIDFVRKNKSYRANFILTGEFHLYGEPQEEDNSEDTWLEAVLDLSKEELFEMVASLPPATRIAFNLYVIDEWSHKQISKHLKISEGTSKWHLSNARTILKEQINRAVELKNNISSHEGKAHELR